MNYTNPRRAAEILDWPSGGLRTSAFFDIETVANRGERAVRRMANPRTGKFTTPKKLTYSVAQRIVDGDDGRTYILCKTMYGGITVMQGNMQFTQESISSEDPRFAELWKMFKE